MCNLPYAALFVLTAFAMSSLAGSPQPGSSTAPSEARSRIRQAVTGPERTMNQAIAVGATATITLQPVPPKTIPVSDYPSGSSITGSTLTLGSVPARVWLEAHITGWAPELLKTFQVKIDATDEDGDGGGYYGVNADCGGMPVTGAGDLLPAIAPCTSNLDCRALISGRSSPCFAGEPSHCILRPAFLPPGGNVCEWGFFDMCDPEYMGSGMMHIAVFDLPTLNTRWGSSVELPDSFTDFAPSYAGTLVIDVPANAKGRYVIDVKEDECFMWNHNAPPNNNIPIAAINLAVIQAATCDTNMDCQDNDACTIDECRSGCCDHTPVAGWDPATECCNPASGVQGPIPQSTSCKTGACSLGGSSGIPSFVNLPDGANCASSDPCYGGGQCLTGQCVSEQYAGSSCPKPRFISFDIGTGPTPSAYRVRMVSLHHPDPPYAGGTASDFSAFEGLYRWVGAPDTYVESGADPTPVYAAIVGCDPHYQNWSAIDLLHVSGAEIVPSSVYEVQSIAVGLDINVESNYSAPVTIATARWCDVVIPNSPPGTTTQPDAGDHAALVGKFRSMPSAISKPRALLGGLDAAGIPSLGSDVSFAEISAAVDAFRGRPYPFAGPIPCP
jgi:hypothetical protein